MFLLKNILTFFSVPAKRVGFCLFAFLRQVLFITGKLDLAEIFENDDSSFLRLFPHPQSN